MNLIQNWTSSWKFLSQQFTALSTTLLGTWIVVPDMWKTAKLNSAVVAVAIALNGLAMFGRLIQQTSLPPPDPPHLP